MKATLPMKKLLICGLTAAMVLGGSASVFADGKGKGNNRDHDDDGDNRNSRVEWKSNAKADANVVVNGNIIINFYDVKGLDWAERHIASLASWRIFEGYEDGSFQPHKPVTRIEAITAAVRLMGLRDQAESQAEMSTHLNFSDAGKVEQKYPWAVGYVAVALENDLFAETETSVQPERPADRLWATTLLIKAMKLEGEAKAKMNTQLTFRDADKIPAGAVGYVAVAIEKGLIDGYEDNTFRPDRPVTRAELAKLLDLTGDQLPQLQSGQVKGTVTAAVANGTLTVKDSKGQNVQVKIDPNTIILNGIAVITAADLKAGDIVKVRITGGTAVFIQVTNTTTTPPANQFFTVDGLFSALTRNGQGKINTVTVYTTPSATVTGSVYNTYQVSPEAQVIGGENNLVPAKPVQLKGANSLVYSIQIK